MGGANRPASSLVWFGREQGRKQGRRRMQRRFFEPEVELVAAAVARVRRGLRLAFCTVRRTGDADMKMLGVAVPGPHLGKPAAISSGLAAQRLLDRGVDEDARDRRILRSGADDLNMRM